MSQTLHHAAARGFAANAAVYASGRPDYPAEITSWLDGALGLGPGRRVIDLGAGTGKFTARLLETGAEVIAVEPIDEMRRELVARLANVDVRKGSAQAIPAGDGSVDAVVCAQAFHWFATSEALAEIARVVRRGGALGLVWNVRDLRVAWVEELTEILKPYEGDAPRQASGVWRDLFPAVASGRHPFGPLEEMRFDYAHAGPAERVVIERTLSISFIASLPKVEQGRVRQQLEALISRTPDLCHGGDVTFPYVTMAYRSARA